MEKLLEAVKSKYLEEMTRVIPLTRLISFGVILISVHIAFRPAKERSIESILAIKMSEFFAADSGILLSISIKDILLALLTSIFSAFLYRYLRHACFEKLSVLSNMKEHVINLAKIGVPNSTNIDLVDYELSRTLEPMRVNTQRALGSFSSFGEALFALGVLSLFIGLTMNVAGLALATIFFVFTLIVQVFTYLKYVKEYLPIDIQHSILLKKRISVRDPLSPG